MLGLASGWLAAPGAGARPPLMRTIPVRTAAASSVAAPASQFFRCRLGRRAGGTGARGRPGGGLRMARDDAGGGPGGPAADGIAALPGGGPGPAAAPPGACCRGICGKAPPPRPTTMATPTVSLSLPQVNPRLAEQGVDQRALSALGLPGDQHAQPPLAQPGAQLVQRGPVFRGAQGRPAHPEPRAEAHCHRSRARVLPPDQVGAIGGRPRITAGSSAVPEAYPAGPKLRFVLLALGCLVPAAALPLVIRLVAAGLAPVVPQVVTSGALKSPWVVQPVFGDFSILSPSWL